MPLEAWLRRVPTHDVAAAEVIAEAWSIVLLRDENVFDDIEGQSIITQGRAQQIGPRISRG